MKVVSVILSLAAASMVHAADDAPASGSIRAARKAELGDVKVQYEVEKKRERKELSDKHLKMRKDAFDRHFAKKGDPDSDVSTDENQDSGSGDRKLYKAKTGISKLMWDDDAMHAGRKPINRPGLRDDDGPGWGGGNMRDDDNHWGMRDDDGVWGGKPGWGGGSSKSDKPGWGGGSSKSDKPGLGGSSSKSDKGGIGKPGGWDDDWTGGSGKSGKGSYGDDWMGGSGKSGKSSGGGHNGLCQVTVTNLSYKQAFSKMFVMLHEKYVTHYFPLYEFGQGPSQEMCDLTTDLNANGLQAFYAGRPGVDRAWITSDYFNIQNSEVTTTYYLDGGATFKFLIRPSSSYLSLAAGFPFANDGGIVLQAAPIFAGAEYYLPAIDSGCEANLQTCWSVPANQQDFQTLAPRSECAWDDVSDINNNEFAGENFVSIHRGIQDLDDKSDFATLSLLECDQLYGESFAHYFRAEGYDDDLLLCQSVGANGFCTFRDDDDFLRFISSNNEVVGDDDILIQIARNSNSYEEFCKNIIDINKGLDSAFKVLEGFIFDFRNPIARVNIDC